MSTFINGRLSLVTLLLLGWSLLVATASAASHSPFINQARHKAFSRSRAHLASPGELLLPRALDHSVVPMSVERRGTFAKRREVRRACSATSSSRSPPTPSSSAAAAGSSSARSTSSSSSAVVSAPSATASASASTASQADDGVSTIEVTATSTVQTTIYASPSTGPTSTTSSSAAAQSTAVVTVDRAGAGPFQGDATWFATGLGACGWVNTADDNIVAVSSLLFDSWPGYAGGNPNNNPICNQKIRVSLPSAGTSVEVTVADRCVGCAERDLDFTEGAFEQLVPGGLDVGRIGMSWEWI